MRKRRQMSFTGLRACELRVARRWKAERARIHEHNLAALREGRENAVVIVLPSSYREGWSEWRGQLSFPAAMRDAAIRAGTLMRDPYENLY